jgi:hypothetical protein
MPTFANKALWAENMDSQADVDRIFKNAQLMGAGAVAIRTTSDIIPAAITRFHGSGIQVYGWRWPAVVQHAGGRYAIDEANFVAQTLIPAGLDGYIVDPESESNNKAYNDWNRTDIPVPVAQLATSFCQIILGAAHAGGNNNFLFGLTSGGNYPATYNNLPWKQFVAASNAVFPQLYWRARDDSNVCQLVRDGTPNTAFNDCLPCWRAIAQGKPIIPIGGEISCVPDVAEIATFGNLAKAAQLATMHFYTDDTDLTAAVCNAIKAL